MPDGSAAARLARDDDFDLLILDLGLPDLDGVEVLRQVRAHGQRLPVVILSARDDVADKVQGLELGADDYVTKPFRFEELLARVRVRRREQGRVRRPYCARVACHWGYDYDPGSNVVDVYVGYLRKKLGPARIKTVRGMGYLLDPEP